VISTFSCQKRSMDLEKLLQKDIQDFIHGHISVDIKSLSLKKLPFAGTLRAQILQQIHARQKAQHKLVKWATRKEIIFPNPDLVEQASSDATAAYKASLFPQGNIFLDLSAGMGSDFLALSEKFTSGYCVEADPAHAQLLEYNLKVLSDKNVIIINDYAENFTKTMPDADLVYIDPQRRNETGKRGIYDLSQTRPNILELLPVLRQKSSQILIKTSPFLDITEALLQLGGAAEVHVLESQGQCKEVLYLIKSGDNTPDTVITAANCDTGQKIHYEYRPGTDIKPGSSAPLTYLYEPSPALMKSGLHSRVATDMGLKKLADMTHLYTSEALQHAFMGRKFLILSVLPVKKQAASDALPDRQANITTRNFPMKPEDLRKKLGLKDGGDHTLFGCTLQNGDKRLILCKSA